MADAPISPFSKPSSITLKDQTDGPGLTMETDEDSLVFHGSISFLPSDMEAPRRMDEIIAVLTEAKRRIAELGPRLDGAVAPVKGPEIDNPF